MKKPITTEMKAPKMVGMKSHKTALIPPAALVAAIEIPATTPVPAIRVAATSVQLILDPGEIELVSTVLRKL